MIFKNLSELRGAYQHVYLSPHLDDAALSCGGTIARQRAAGERVLVVTICTAAPPAEGPFSPLAQSFHAAWGLSPGEVVAARLCEDEVAMTTLDVDALWAGELDAIYRHPVAYHARETLFGTPAPDDPLLPSLRRLVSLLRERLPEATLYAPLGVGHHVDHLLTWQAAYETIGAQLLCYEDFPYVARAGELERRLAEPIGKLAPRVTAVDQTLCCKVGAVRAYGSQLAELAHSQLGHMVSAAEAATLMAAAITNYARQVGGERVWATARV